MTALKTPNHATIGRRLLCAALGSTLLSCAAAARSDGPAAGPADDPAPTEKAEQAGQAEQTEPAGTDPAKEERFLSRVRQLTFDGRRTGEGYYAPSGDRLVFQSEREADNPFYQIYEMDLETGETRRISPGHGKTTCAFFRPGTLDVLFSSTHLDPDSKKLQQDELDFRASGQERRYAWDYDTHMDLFVEIRETGELKRLTQAKGYDAEGSYSPDGEWIVFSSNRDAYSRELSEEERKQLEIDPAYFLDLYVMRHDGSDLKRITDVPGYDGGPFFMPDGEHVVWRRFDPSGLTADVWTARMDGSDAKRITDFGSMSWAPYGHPSGEYIVFTSNKHGFGNFELFIVDRDGTKEPVRVTYTDGFDGLPVPAPDGKTLTWTTTRGGGGSQLFTARWNHEEALRALAEAPPRKPAGSSKPAGGRP